MRKQLGYSLLTVAILVSFACGGAQETGEEPATEVAMTDEETDQADHGFKKPSPADVEAAAKGAAVRWFQAFITADVASAVAISAVPFSFDRKQEIATLEELTEILEKASAEKGAQPIPQTDVVILIDHEIRAHAFPNQPPDTLMVRLKVEGEGIVFCVRPSDPPVVVGLSD